MPAWQGAVTLQRVRWQAMHLPARQQHQQQQEQQQQEQQD
jgi:hypothetical protein